MLMASLTIFYVFLSLSKFSVVIVNVQNMKIDVFSIPVEYKIELTRRTHDDDPTMMNKMRVYKIKIIIIICFKTNDIKIKLKTFFLSPRHSFHSRLTTTTMKLLIMDFHGLISNESVHHQKKKYIDDIRVREKVVILINLLNVISLSHSKE